MLKSVFAFIGLTFGANVFAANTLILPPFYSSRAELETILKSNELREIFGSGRPILGINKVEDDGDGVEGYVISTTRHCSLFVKKERVVTSPHVGPARYNYLFGALTCPEVTTELLPDHSGIAGTATSLNN